MATPLAARAQAVKPRLTAISQWSAGSDGAAITALGKKFEERGGVWQHSPVPGFTTDMMNKLRAQIIAGDPPACSQLKGPEIAAWSKIAPTVNLDATVAAAGYEKVVAPDLARLHKPGGKWAALPLQVYRTNTLFLSKRAMDKAKANKIPTTWAQFNELGEKMKAAGVAHPVANGGTRADDGQKFEAVLAGLNPGVYRKAIMELDRAVASGESPQGIIVMTLRHFQRLHRLRAALEMGRSFDDAARSMRPPLHFKTRGVIEAQIRAWDAARLDRAIAVISRTAKDARLASQLESTLAERMMLELAAMVARR